AQKQNQEKAGNKPPAVAIAASAGHSRSQRMLQRARLRARPITASLLRCGMISPVRALSMVRSVNSLSDGIHPTVILARNQSAASGQKVGTHRSKARHSWAE